MNISHEYRNPKNVKNPGTSAITSMFVYVEVKYDEKRVKIYQY